MSKNWIDGKSIFNCRKFFENGHLVESLFKIAMRKRKTEMFIFLPKDMLLIEKIGSNDALNSMAKNMELWKFLNEMKMIIPFTSLRKNGHDIHDTMEYKLSVAESTKGSKIRYIGYQNLLEKSDLIEQH